MVEGRAAASRGGLAAPEVDAPMPGKVLKMLVAEGEPVEHGDPLIVLEAMKMETTLYAESPAIVAKICVVAGQMVDHGARPDRTQSGGDTARPPESPLQTTEPMIEVGIAIDDDFELAGAEHAHAARMLGAERNHHRLARDSQRVGHRENALDFRQSNALSKARPPLASRLLFTYGAARLSSTPGDFPLRRTLCSAR